MLFPGDYSLKTVYLQDLDIKDLVIEFNLYESINSTTISADLVISDNKDIISTLKGLESVYIEVSTKGKLYKLNFLLYKIDSRTMESKSQMYIMRLCTVDMVNNEYSRFSSRFRTSITDIVEHLLKDRLKTDKNILLEDSLFNINFLNPNWRIFEFISFLSKRTIPKINTKTCGYLFYENLDGYNFKSVDSLIKQKSINFNNPFTYTQANIPLSNNNVKQNRIIKYQSTDYFDILKNIRMGTFSHSNIKLNFNERTKFTTNVNLDRDSWNNINHLGVIYPFPDKVDNPSRIIVRPITDTLYDKKDVSNDFIEKSVYRYLSLQYYNLSIHIAGNLDIRVGNVVDVNIPSPNPTDKTRDVQLDTILSGKFLVHSVKTTINRTDSYTILHLCKDS